MFTAIMSVFMYGMFYFVTPAIFLLSLIALIKQDWR